MQEGQGYTLSGHEGSPWREMSSQRRLPPMVASALHIVTCGHFTEEVTTSPCFIAKEMEALRGEVVGWTWTSLLVGWVICYFGH